MVFTVDRVRASSAARQIFDLSAIDFHFKAVCMDTPIGYPMHARIPALRRLNGALDTSRPTNFNGPLQTLELMSIGTHQVLEEIHLIGRHGLTSYRRTVAL
jgi:hypothetical protein